MNSYLVTLGKEQSTYLKGWAVLFMVFLHFGDNHVLPEFRWAWSGNDWNASFQMCVPMFLFLSGYGLAKSRRGKGRGPGGQCAKTARRALSLLKRYWFAVLPFVLLGLASGKFQFSVGALLLNLTALKPSWCGPAWFVFLYIELIFLFPLAFAFVSRSSAWRVAVAFVALVLATKALMKVPWVAGEATILARQLKMLLIDSPIFFEGMLFAHYGVVERAGGWMERRVPLRLFNLSGGGIGMAMVAASIAVRAKLPLVSVTELVHVPLCLLGLLLMARRCRPMAAAMGFVGRHSTTLWFIHTYFCWTFLQPLVYGVRLWPVAFALLVGLSLAVSVAIDFLYSKTQSSPR